VIGFSDATLLAITKLRTRRIRTLVTVFISGLLFAGLVAANTIAQGASNSVQSFSQEGLNNRYIVSATPDPPLHNGVLGSAVILNRAQQIYNQLVVSKEAAAKSLGVQYDPTTEISPIENLAATANTPAQQLLNLSSPAGLQAVSEYIQAHPSPGIDRLKQVAAPYHPTGFYEVEQTSQTNGQLSTMQNGVEDFTAYGQAASAVTQNDILQKGSLEKAPQQLTNPFLLHKVSKQTDSNAIPIIVPYSDAEQLLNLKALPKDASSSQQLARVEELYARAGSIVFAACYRNSVSASQISTAISDASAISENQGNKDYQKPDLIYGLPSSTSCGQATIVSDTRTSAEKTAGAKQDEFTQMFGGIVEPVQQKLIFRVVGLTPDQSSNSNTTFGGILQNIVGSSLNGGIVIPSNMLDDLPDAAAINAILFPTVSSNPLASTGMQYFAEFGNAGDARNFINNESCTTRSDGTCATPTKPFQLNAFGSGSIALQDLQHKLTHYFKLAALGVIFVGLVIMSSMVGRTIVDGRRETAVFRAVGAKRADIIAVYGIYTLCLSVCVALFALVAGLLFAYGFNKHYTLATTVEAKLLYGASNSARVFSFFSVNWRSVGMILGLVVACGLLSATWPLLRNVRRSPIKDMREE
jgi:ABC-type antimicrobial peptide transport system permease subunit